MRRANAVEHRDATHRVLADRRFPAEHHRVDLFVHRVGDVGDLGSGRHRVVDHRFQQVGRHDHRPAGDRTAPHHVALGHREHLELHLDAEIAPEPP